MTSARQTPSWAAVVPTLGAPTLGAALRAIREQEPRPFLVVVAQGTISSADLALADRVVDLASPRGFAVAANAGLVEALDSGAPFVGLARIWPHPGALVRGLGVHRSALARAASDHLPLVATLDL